MGWLPSIFGGSSEQSSDPLGKLDPKLREFLEKESPVKYTTNSSNPSASSTTQQAQTPTTAAAEPQSDKPAVPSVSLYQDGRHAHIWKNYKPQEQVEAETETDHDKMQRVLEGFKERKAAIGKASMENCALQQEEWVNCMKHGSWEDQLQMCRHQVRRFERCYTMQSRFLRALGYGSVPGRAAIVDEDIQMHSDSLFQRMLAHEAAVEKAKADGTPAPAFDLRLPAPKAAVVPSEEVQQQWKGMLEKLPEEERALEEAALRADLKIKSDLARDVKRLRAEAKENAANPDNKNTATTWEIVSALFGGGNK